MSTEIVAAGPGPQAGLDDHIYNRLLKERIIFLGSDVRDDNANAICAQMLLLAAEDPEKDIWLYINSPGGSVTGSETIWREVARVRAKGKPVVASMGAVAASGGYYISMDADTIVANPGTITGSIGVLTGKLIAVFIAVVGCGRGFRAQASAEGVGKAAKDSVVISFILVLIFNYFITSIARQFYPY